MAYNEMRQSLVAFSASGAQRELSVRFSSASVDNGATLPHCLLFVGSSSRLVSVMRASKRGICQGRGAFVSDAST